MATGDITWFDQALLDLGEKLHDLSSDTFKLGLVTAVVTPATNTSDPRWGAGGGTNLATNKVAEATAWTGPVTLGSATVAARRRRLGGQEARRSQRLGGPITKE